MEKKQKLLFVGQNLCVGGVQTAFLNHLNRLAKDPRYEITVFLFSKGKLFEQIPKSVNVILGSKLLQLISLPFSEVRESGNVIKTLIRAGSVLVAKLIGVENFYRLCFKRLPTKYDIAISYFTDGLNATFNRGTNLFVSEYINADTKVTWVHNDPILAEFDHEYCQKIYLPFDGIVCVSDAVREKFNEFLPEYKDKTTTFHNVFDEEKIKFLAKAYVPFEKTDFDIVTVAREDNKQKRIDGIIQICRRLKEEGTSGFRWRVVGDGPSLESNRLLTETLEVDDLITLEGEKTNPYPYIHRSDLFALYSAYEGFPMVVGEAQALGAYILTTNYAAAKEQISPEQGYIAQSDEDFYQELKRLIQCRN